MTTAGDIVVGGASGVPTRQAKGANNRVFGVDASGVLGYRQIVDADVATGANIAWEKLKGQGYAMTVPGSVDGTNIQAQYIETMMRDNMMPGSKIVDQSIPAGKLATGSVTNDEIQPNTIHPGRLTSWSGSTYGNHLLYDVAGGGGISVAKLDNAFINDNTISGGKLQDNTIPGSKFTAESISYVHIIDGTIRAYEIGGRAITSYGGMQGNFGAIGAGAWSYTNHVAGVAGLYPGASLTYVIFTIGVQASTVNALLGVAIGVDTTASPTWYCHGSQPTANGVVNMVVSGLHLATGSAHNYYGLVYTNVGTIAAYGVCQIWAVSFHR